ncbi:folylpolyglutamate synthase, mitochondrial-like [Sinocyclocheilus anshuiensis]|uniref:folylpolyglutamate synthase, mitochondrial-like n=1 Tax=Sinocyclocheilus anshuiensis TaxID=1608454 RepID=UPI0007B91FD2|nr:PREDICTED: folylpolyglutamate synthase, mitochondrial-like [Sinocyclocheilus anshuiensis]
MLRLCCVLERLHACTEASASNRHWTKIAELSVRFSSTKAAPRFRRMDYQDAVCTLNTLQTNASALEQVKRERGHPQLQLQAMRGFLQRAGLKLKSSSHCENKFFLVNRLIYCNAFLRRPWVCGISSLGIDHTSILGDTIEKIAWQKGGIFKLGVPAFTVKQPDGPMKVLQERAEETGCSLSVCPDLEEYESEGSLSLGLAGHHQCSNASLALQLSHTWLQRHFLTDPASSSPVEFSGVSSAPVIQPSPAMIKGLAETEWPGRNQMLKHSPVTYFLDGAHTTRSMLACVRWFNEVTPQHERNAGGSVVRVLLFNATGERDCAAMLKLLVPCHFDFAVFCPNITEAIATCNADQQNFNVSVENMLTRCLDNQQSWRVLNGQEEKPEAELLIGGGLPLVAERHTDTLVFPCILSALQWISQGRDSALSDPNKCVIPVKPSIKAKAAPLREAVSIHVLITGSLHLVGGALKHLDPSLNS